MKEARAISFSQNRIYTPIVEQHEDMEIGVAFLIFRMETAEGKPGAYWFLFIDLV